MGDYILFLCWILVLYSDAWHYTVVRKESELIEVDRKLAKILFFIKNTDGMSVVSIILGLTAHAGMIFFLFLVIYSKTVKRYMRILFFLWYAVSILLMAAGALIETFIKRKRAKTKQDREWSSVWIIILELIVAGAMIYLIVGQVLVLKNAIELFAHGSA